MSAPMDAWDGRPENPELDGDHMIQVDQHPPRAWRWDATQQHYTIAGREDALTAPDMVAEGFVYLGPALLPSDLAARDAETREKALREAAEVAQKAWPRAHTYSSENADLYRAQDHAVATAIRAILALIPPPKEARTDA